MCYANTPKESRFSYASRNVDPRETVAGHSGWCQPKENLGLDEGG